MKYTSKCLIAIAFSIAASAAHSASIGLRPDRLELAPGTPAGTAISFELVVDFGTQLVFGGATDIKFDPAALSLRSGEWFQWDSAFGPIATDSTPPNRMSLYDVRDATQGPGLVSIGFGNDAGVTGAFTVGKLLLNLAQDAKPGPIATLTLTDSGKWGGFTDVPGLPIQIAYAGATVTAVPLPSSAWLFATGLAMLGMLRLRRRTGI
jgi:hypothetical protein